MNRTESLMSGIKFESCPNFVRFGGLNCGKEDSQGYRCDESKEKVSNSNGDDNVADLLPLDPFGMDIETNSTEGSEKVNDDNPALFLALSYLGFKDLVSVERVCKSLRDAVVNDPLLWRRIHVDHSLSDKITDDALLRFANRAQGNLNYLSLVDCSKISMDGLKLVLERNRRLTKLSIAGCLKLRFDGLLSILKAIRSAGNLGIKRLRIGRLPDITNEQFEELKMLLGISDNSELPTSCKKSRFYRGDQSYLSLEDDRAIDVEACPRCPKMREVYDCPSESCQRTQCRGCIVCIPRCKSCGYCISNRPYEETFFLENLCFGCKEVFARKHGV